MTEDKRPTDANEQDKQSASEKRRTKAFYIRLIIIYAICMLLLLLAINYDSFATTLNKFGSVLMPLIYGCIIAYLCNPLYNLFFEKALVKLKSVRWRKVLALVLTYIVIILVIFAMLFILIQQMVINVQNFLANIDTYIKNAETFLFDIIEDLGFIKSEEEMGGTTLPPEVTEPSDGIGTEATQPEGDATAPDTDNKLSGDIIDPSESVEIFDFSFTKEGIIDFITEFFNDSKQLISQIGNAIVESGTAAAITVFNIFLGFIFSVYILTERDLLCAKAKKITMSVCRGDKGGRFINLVNYSNAKIGHFVKGKILESVIVGAMSYLLFLIFGIPSPLMIAMIVAIMNMIPFFGPFLGAIPAALLVLIIDPSKTIAYIIIVIVIMQINGNYISPKIVGNSTGLTPFGAMTALVLMSGYFGLIGMFIGIPICAIVVELIWRDMNRRLEEKELSQNIDDYYSPKAMAILAEERAHPVHHRNLTAVVVDELVLLFNIIFRRHKLKESNDTDSDENNKSDKSNEKNKKQEKSRK